MNPGIYDTAVRQKHKKQNTGLARVANFVRYSALAAAGGGTAGGANITATGLLGHIATVKTHRRVIGFFG